MGSVCSAICSSEASVIRPPKAFSHSELTVASRHRKDSSDVDSANSSRLFAYKVLFPLGAGAHGKVYCLEKDGVRYAMKKINKAALVARKISFDSLVNEKNIMKNSKSTFVVGLNESFQDDSYAYIVMDYCAGGELLQALRTNGPFNESVSCFYTMQIVLGLKALHESGVIYRDLKPENVLLTQEGNLKLADFGIAKVGAKKASTRCGTLLYMAPEILRGIAYNFSVDFWGLGCLVFEMLHGKNPFEVPTEREIKARIFLGAHHPFSPSISEEAKSLIKGLLEVDPSKRLGSKGIRELMEHPFFQRMSWEDVESFKVQPPIRPTIGKSPRRVSLFRNSETNHYLPTAVKIPNFTDDAENIPSSTKVIF